MPTRPASRAARRRALPPPYSRVLLLAGALLLAGGPAAAAAQEAPRPLVVLDAGHGGDDPGARGPGGTREKDVALAVARRLAERLREADPRLEVRLTRERDTLVALADRPRLANRWRAEAGEQRPALFVSLHTNAHDRAGVRGYETFFLSEARTEEARRVAEMENAAQRFEQSAPAADDALGWIVQDLRQNLYLHESSQVASLFQRRLRSVHPGPERGVKQASFVVLDGARMPAVLVELGFITHPAEERLLASPEGQQRLVEPLARAVLDFFARGARASVGAGPAPAGPPRS